MGLLDSIFGDDGNLADVPTRFGRAQVYDVEDDAGDTFRVLDVAGTWQSATYVDNRWSDLVFGYHRAFDRALPALTSAAGGAAPRALMLGGGALSYPKHVVVKVPDVQVDVVEIDPAVIELARHWFLLDRLTPEQDARLHVICADAPSELRRIGADAAHPPYALVVNDLFAAAEPTAALMDEEGARLLRSALTPNGIYVANVVSALRGRHARPLRQVSEALSSCFAQVEVVSLGEDEPRVPDNNVVFATNGSYALSELLDLT